MMPDSRVWQALANSAELGNLYRCAILDRITWGRVSRFDPFGGWGYQTASDGAMEFPSPSHAQAALRVMRPAAR